MTGTANVRLSPAAAINGVPSGRPGSGIVVSTRPVSESCTTALKIGGPVTTT